jgi:PAS domain-containing protein
MTPRSDELETENARLQAELAQLRDVLREPEEILRAIRLGEVDGFVVSEAEGEAIYQLRSADVLCRVMIEDMKEGAVAFDTEGTILYCNRHFAGMLKAAREELLGGRIETLVAP